MLIRVLLLLLLPLFAAAQDCDCCKLRTLGQAKFDKGDYAGAKSTWTKAKNMGDAAKCSDLDALIAKAKKKIPPPPPKPKKTKPVPPSFNSNPIASPVQHSKKSGLTMIPVEGGSYTMGSPESEANRESNECQHTVTVGNYAIGRYEVTQADWVEVMGSNPSSFSNCDECPVESVSWNEVKDFITKANTKYGRRFRLPTEAEWEYAARGGKKSKGYIYAGSNMLDEVAWYNSNSDSKTHNAGTKSANELGLYDLSGNVWEWCQDTWGPYPGCSEPSEADNTRRVLRGGSWVNYSLGCRVAYRYWFFDTGRDSDYGFRLAQD